MQGPDESRHYCKADYRSIVPDKSFAGIDAFCDEKGNTNTEMPVMDWTVTFIKDGEATRVEVDVKFASEADMKTIIETGFKEGFAAAHNNLDELLAK